MGGLSDGRRHKGGGTRLRYLVQPDILTTSSAHLDVEIPPPRSS
jgi:hypothetical protein